MYFADAGEQSENLRISDVGAPSLRQKAAPIVVDETHCSLRHRIDFVPAIRYGLKGKTRAPGECRHLVSQLLRLESTLDIDIDSCNATGANGDCRNFVAMRR